MTRERLRPDAVVTAKPRAIYVRALRYTGWFALDFLEDNERVYSENGELRIYDGTHVPTVVRIGDWVVRDVDGALRTYEDARFRASFVIADPPCDGSDSAGGPKAGEATAGTGSVPLVSESAVPREAPSPADVSCSTGRTALQREALYEDALERFFARYGLQDFGTESRVVIDEAMDEIYRGVIAGVPSVSRDYS